MTTAIPTGVLLGSGFLVATPLAPVEPPERRRG
jgi:hypothetical protein